MTSSRTPRRPQRGSAGRRGQVEPVPSSRSAVGERLRDARELLGVDLYRVERDTKIRSKYLAALESGEFADLPGDVYTRGFLRNYATYLGLDADEIEEQWREEAGEVQLARPMIVGPQPLTIRRRLVLQRSHLVLAMVAIMVLIVGSYFGFQLTRYLSYPTLSVESGGGAPVVVDANTTSYVLKGTATPGTTVLIAWNGQEPKIVIADDKGHWSFQAVLQTGSNQFDITAENLDTSHASATVRMIVIVPTPTATPPAPEVAFATPGDGDAVLTGVVTVTGTSVEVSSVTLTATQLGPPLYAGSSLAPPTPVSTGATLPGATPPGPSGTPVVQQALTKVAADGTFTVTMTLVPGRYLMTLVGATAAGGHTKAVSRALNVQYRGINVLIQIRGGKATVGVYHDGVPDTQPFGQADGWSLKVVATRYVCVTAPSGASNVYVTINGTFYGSITSFGGTHVYVDAKCPRNTTGC